MALSAKGKTRIASSKNNRPVTLKHLAATLALEHQLTKKAGEALLGDLVGRITKHLKKGERIRFRSGFGRFGSGRPRVAPGTGEAIQTAAEGRIPGGQGFEDGNLTHPRPVNQSWVGRLVACRTLENNTGKC